MRAVVIADDDIERVADFAATALADPPPPPVLVVAPNGDMARRALADVDPALWKLVVTPGQVRGLPRDLCRYVVLNPRELAPAQHDVVALLHAAGATEVSLLDLPARAVQ